MTHKTNTEQLNAQATTSTKECCVHPHSQKKHEGDHDECKSKKTTTDPLLPYLKPLQPSPSSSKCQFDVESVRSALMTEGYAILPSILTSQECKDCVDDIWEYIEVTSQYKVNRQDPASYYPPSHYNNNKKQQHPDIVDPWPHSHWKSFPDMFQTNHAGWVLHRLRQILAERVFEPLFHTAELHCTKEGFTFHRPMTLTTQKENQSQENNTTATTTLYHPAYTHNSNETRRQIHVCSKPQSLSQGEHVDQSCHEIGLHHIQSVTSFLPQHETQGDGCFLCWPTSHNHHLELTQHTYRGQHSNWVPFTDEELHYLQKQGLNPRKVYAQAGDVILWRSDLVHAACSPELHCQNFRAVGYVGMLPAKLTTAEGWRRKLAAYKTMRTGDHCADMEVWHDDYGDMGVGKEKKSTKKKNKKNKKNKKKLQEDSTKEHIVHDLESISPSLHLDNEQPKTNQPLLNTNVQEERCNQVDAHSPHVSTYHRYGPPLVTWRQAQLYGLVPYNTTNNNNDNTPEPNTAHAPTLQAVQKAMIRGVRFTPQVLLQVGLEPPEHQEDGAKKANTIVHQRPPRPPPPSGARLVILSPEGPPMDGQDKWLGGMSTLPFASSSSSCCHNGHHDETNKYDHVNEPLLNQKDHYVYGVPGNARTVLRTCVRTGHVDQLPIQNATAALEDFSGKFKWLRGVEAPPPPLFTNQDKDNCVDPASTTMRETYPLGSLIALPSNATCILRINPYTQTATAYGGPFLGDWKWHGGCLAEDGYIYAIPCNAKRILRVHPFTEEAEEWGPVLLDGNGNDNGDGRQKWYGGIKAKNGCIYGIPQNARGVLKIDPSKEEVSILNRISNGNNNNKSHDQAVDCFIPEGQWKWHGGTTNHNQTVIYGFPNNADTVLKIDTTTDTLSLLGSKQHEIQSGRHRIPQDGKYKYLGGALSPAFGGRFLYLFPCDAERVLCIDTVTEEVCCVGPRLLEGENKYQNGFASGEDGAVYAIPQRASGVLKVTPPPPALGDGKHGHEGEVDGRQTMVDVLYCGDEMVGCKDKFEGGVQILNGEDGECVYCIPLRAKRLIKVIPPR